MKKSVIFVTIILLLFGQCANKGEEEAKKNLGYPIRKDIIQGIKTVMNPDYPRDGLFTYRMADVITLGREGEPNDGILFFPYIIRVDPIGNIYVLDAEDVNIKIYDRNGRWIRNVGRRGQGPGEYTNLSDFDVSIDGRIFILDTQQHCMLILKPDGTFDSRILLKGSCLRLKVDSIGQVYLQQNISFIRKGDHGSYEMEMILKRIDSRGKNLFEYGKFPYSKVVWGPKKTERGIRIVSHRSREAHSTVWIVGKEDQLFVGYSGNYLITVFDRKGKPLFRFGREFNQVKHPLFNPDLAHPRHYPAFYSRYLFIDDEGNLWLKQYDENEKTDHLYDVFSRDGIFIRQAVVPERIFLYQNGKAYTIVESESGEYVAKCYKLVEVKSSGF
jgi:hypothetical protein